LPFKRPSIEDILVDDGNIATKETGKI